MKNQEISYLEKEIIDWRHRIENEHYQFIMNKSSHSDDYEDSFIEDQIINGIQYLYFNILAYIEIKGLTQYSNNFKNKYDEKIKDKRLLLKTRFFNPEFEPELVILHEFRQYLSPFKAFDYSASREEEVNRLIEVLKSTSYILKNAKTEITNESSIYKEVLWVLKLYFPSCRKKK